MSEKVRLPKSVCDALDYCIKEKYADHEILAYAKDAQFVNNLEILNKQNPSELMRALVLGYEPVMTPEEQIKNLYENHLKTSSAHHIYQVGIRDALRIHGIHYDWLEGYAE